MNPRKISFQYFSVAVFLLLLTTVAYPGLGQEAEKPWLGLNYGPFRDEQSPQGTLPSEAEIAEDMQIIAQQSISVIRIYSVQGPGEQIVKSAQDHDIKVVIQAWIGTDHNNNEREINKAIEIAKDYPNVIGILVGSEVLLRNAELPEEEQISVEELIGYIRTVREALPTNIPVGYADDYTRWIDNPEVAQAVDWIGLHSYGFFSCQPVNQAAAFAIGQWGQMLANPVFQNKKIILFEVGWPTEGFNQSCPNLTQGSEAAQTQYVSDIIANANAAKLDLFLFEFADEQWKCFTGDEPGFGCHWGLVDSSRNPKPAWGVLKQTDSQIATVQTGDGAAANCRIGPGANLAVVKSIPVTTTVSIIGHDADQTWWLIRSEESDCWVHGNLLVDSSGKQLSTSRPATPTPSSPLITIIRASNSALCQGSKSEEMSIKSWTADLATAASCVRNLLAWESNAIAQQTARVQAGTCGTQPTPDQLTPYFAENWALTDLAIGYFNLGQRLQESGNYGAAREAFQIIVNNYSCAWAWDPQGWFWSLAEGARVQLQLLP